MLDSPASDRFLSASLLEADEAGREAGCKEPAPFVVSLLAAPEEETGGALDRG